ncbi:MAG: tetratricopeptide repeat protein [Desulfobulbus sp.]
MDSAHNHISRPTWILVILALIIGFIGGAVFAVYRLPGGDAQQATQGRDASQALAQLEEQARQQPENAQAWAELGHAYYDTGNVHKAIDAYHKALQLRPGDLDVMTDLGVMYHQNNQHDEALSLFTQVLRENPRHRQARFNRGVVLLTGRNDREGALDEWRQLVRDFPMASTPSGKYVIELIEELEQQSAPQKSPEQK